MYISECNRLKLNLSFSCYQRIDSDSQICDISISKLIENIVIQYCKAAERVEKLKDSTENKYNLISKILSNSSKMLFFKTLSKLSIKLINENTENAVFSRRKLSGEKKTYIWTVTNKARVVLSNDVLSKDESGPFIAELLEEYSELDYGMREKIMLLDKVDLIKRAIDGNYPLKFKSQTGRTHIIHPYKIVTDPDLRYNYLVGDNFDNKSSKVGSVRIFNMLDLTILRKEKNLANDIEIEKALLNRSVPYLQSENKIIEVLLNENGESKYRRLLHDRPHYISHDDEYIDGYKRYIFKCSEFQAEIYFTRFGDSAIIINPKELKEKMQNYYKSAYELYDSK